MKFCILKRYVTLRLRIFKKIFLGNKFLEDLSVTVAKIARSVDATLQKINFQLQFPWEKLFKRIAKRQNIGVLIPDSSIYTIGF